MNKLNALGIAFAIAMTVSLPASAQQPAGPPMYGAEITQEMARKAADAAAAEAKKNGWFLAISVVGPSGHLVHFNKMDGTQYGSIAISQHKARAAAIYRRPTKVFQDLVNRAQQPVLSVLTLDDVIASDGGIPIVVGGKLIGAIGCSGATGEQDGMACTAGVNALK